MSVVVSAGVFWVAGRWGLTRLSESFLPGAVSSTAGGEPAPTAAFDDQAPLAETGPNTIERDGPEYSTQVRSGWCLTMARTGPVTDAEVTATALDQAVLRGDWPRARWLLLAGAEPGRRFQPAIERVLARERFSLQLYRAAALGDGPMVRDLIARGADPDVEVGHKLALTPLAWAAVCNWPNAVRALIDGGAEVDRRFAFSIWERQVSGSTALIWASQSESREAVAVLLGAGADVNARETVLTGGRRGPGRTPLDAAAKSDTVMDLLLAAGANPNVADSDGVTVLMVEAQGGDLGRIRQLLDYGADTRRRDVFGLTAEDHAASVGNTAAANMLRPRRRAAERDYPPAPETGQGDPEFVGQAQVIQSVERQAPCPGVTRGPRGRRYPEATHTVRIELRRHGYRNLRYEGKSCVWRVGWLRVPGGRSFQIYGNDYSFGASGLRGTSRLLVLDARGRYLGQYLVDSLDVWIEGPTIRFDKTKWAGDRLTFTASGPPAHQVVDGSEVEFRSAEEPPQGPLNP